MKLPVDLESKKNNHRLLLTGAIGPVLFIVSFTLLGAMRAGYSPIKFPISSLAIGPEGWMQVINFLLSGGFIVIGAVGFRRLCSSLNNSTTISRLLGFTGLGLMGAGIFSTDPVFGYPSAAPFALAQFTFSGHLHDLFSIFVFVCLPLAQFKLRKHFLGSGDRLWANYSLFSACGMFLFFLLAGIGFKQTPVLRDVAGLLQRLSLILGFAWIALFYFSLAKRSSYKNIAQKF